MNFLKMVKNIYQNKYILLFYTYCKFFRIYNFVFYIFYIFFFDKYIQLLYICYISIFLNMNFRLMKSMDYDIWVLDMK